MADISGYLQKVNTATKAKEAWYVEVRGPVLYHWASRPVKDAPPVGAVELKGAKVVDYAAVPNAWSITTEAGKEFVLAATSKEDKTNWMNKVKNYNVNNKNQLKVSEPVEEGEVKTVFSASTKKDKISLKDFEVVSVIGTGSFGKVYHVMKKGTSESYAMKEMNKEVVERENLTAHIFAEKSILQTINHPFIVKLHYAFQTKDRLYLVLDLLSGGELFFHLGQVGVFEEPRARFYVAQIGIALGYLHGLNIIYRDLKPENAVLDKDGFVCLTDFGLAKENVEGAGASTFCGTPEYLAPEFLMGKTYGREVDWWSLGVLMYEMLFGIPPFYDENQNAMYELILTAPLTL
ncbi:RAC serine/threonine-protein kinase [Angomonas deanei]|nr:RAC serine/threonine-protein kinase [Angomonas deanei]|eukprot:EPY40612.1 RAC serine/threonine-protein kinase [Angomonas deanei]